MFWNIFKKKTPLSTSSHDDLNFLPADNKKPTATENINIPISFLKKLMPVAQLLTEKEMQQLSITSASFRPGTVIFNRGTEVESLTYIVKGNIFIEANNGSVLEINANTLKALFPLHIVKGNIFMEANNGSVPEINTNTLKALNSLYARKLHDFTAIAGSDVTVIYISKAILQPNQGAIASLNNELKISEHLKDNPFVNRFYQNFIQGELKIPSFPDIALKLRNAIQQNCEIADIVKIVNMDPVISAKLIQVVNSPIYRTLNPISNCFDAINRLGLMTTRNLVTAFSMKNLTQSKNKSTKKLMQHTWLQSIKVSSISHTLAQLTQKVDPDEALLAGLLHNIGVLPILTFADSLPEGSYQSADIDLCINEMQGQIGSIILNAWGFPDNLRQIPLQSTNWFTSTTEDLNLNDIVLLAKYHNLLTSSGKADLPLLITLPSFQKLEHQPLTPEMSLQILDDAKQQITETMNFFSH